MRIHYKKPSVADAILEAINDAHDEGRAIEKIELDPHEHAEFGRWYKQQYPDVMSSYIGDTFHYRGVKIVRT